MKITRSAAAGAVAALLTAGAGLVAIGTGAIALDDGTAGAAIVHHDDNSATTTVTFLAGELQPAATQLSYDQGICNSDASLSFTSCATSLKACAQTYYKHPASVVVKFDNLERVIGCYSV